MTPRAAAVLAAANLLSGCGPLCGEAEICAIAGDGELGFNGDGLDALDTRLASPTSVAVDPDGRPVVVDYSNMRVRVLQDDGRLVTIAGNGIHAYSDIGAAAVDSPLENPVDATYGPDGLLYLLPQHEGRLLRIEADGRLERVVGTGMLADSGDGGPPLDAELGYGGGFAIADDGTVFISDNSFNRVRRATPGGTIETVLGTGEGGIGDPGHGPDVAIRGPERVLLDPDRGRLLVADTLNHRVLAVDLDTLDTTVFAGTGAAGYAGDGGDALDAQLDSPVGLAVAEDGTVVISDLDNHALRAVDPSGGIDTVAGGVEGDPRSHGAPLAFPLRKPAGLAWTPQGDLLIAERSGHRMLRWQGAADAL